MKEEILKKVNAEVTVECWKSLKKLAIDKDISLQDLVKEILERSMSKKKFEEVKVNE